MGGEATGTPLPCCRTWGVPEAASADTELIDPTGVVGRRMAGWLVDAALICIAVLAVLLLLGDSYQRPGTATDLDVGQFGSDTAIFFRSTVAVVHLWEWAVAAAVCVGCALLLFVLLPARRGWTPGLLAAELRLVDGEGRRARPRQAFVRLVAWIIDIIPGVPVVGLVAMQLGRHHQRVGDRLARTYVVDRAYTDRPPTKPVPVERDGTVTAVDPEVDVSLGSTAESEDVASEQASVRRRLRRPGGHDEGDDETVDAGDDEAGTDDASGSTGTDPVIDEASWAPATDREPPDDDDPDPSPALTSTAGLVPGSGGETPEPPDGVVPDEPRWDRERKQYVMWHGATGRWVAFNDDDQKWRPR